MTPRRRRCSAATGRPRPSRRSCSRRSTCWRSPPASARWSPRVGHVSYTRLHRDRRGRDRRAVLLGLPRDVQHVRPLALPAHLRRDARGPGRRRGARHRGGPVDRACAPASTGSRRSSSASCFGLQPAPGMLLVVPIGFVTGLRLRRASASCSQRSPSTIDNFNYVTSAVLTPMFLVAGTFFPVSALPAGIRRSPQFNPLYHCVQLVRDASLGAAARRRPRPRRGAAAVRHPDVAPRDLAARQRLID